MYSPINAWDTAMAFCVSSFFIDYEDNQKQSNNSLLVSEMESLSQGILRVSDQCTCTQINATVRRTNVLSDYSVFCMDTIGMGSNSLVTAFLKLITCINTIQLLQKQDCQGH